MRCHQRRRDLASLNPAASLECGGGVDDRADGEVAIGFSDEELGRGLREIAEVADGAREIEVGGRLGLEEEREEEQEQAGHG